jgi:hypothetical protein
MHGGSGGGYGQPQHGGHNGYYAPQPQQQPSYGGPVYYNMAHGVGDMGHHAGYDNRKRGFDVLNDFFGDAKRRQLDPHSYPQVGQRLMALHGIPIQGGALVDYAPAPSMVSVTGHGNAAAPPMSQHYALPMPNLPNLRTKSDLLNIDNFLEQMQNTVYESSNAAAAAGVHQPGAHYTHQSINFRQSHSPPQTAMHNQLGRMGTHGANATSAAPMMAPTSSHSPQSGTPALTPPSSTNSYTSGHSPISAPGLSPPSRHSSTTLATYPTLPAVSSGYPAQSHRAPTSTLGPNFDHDARRRFSGGMLQRSAGPREPDSTDDHESPRPASKESTPRASSVDMNASEPPASFIDPALSGADSSRRSTDSGESAQDRAQELWVENIRIIEALRHLVNDRLVRGLYEDDDVEMRDDESRNDEMSSQTEGKDDIKTEGENLYPVLNV